MANPKLIPDVRVLALVVFILVLVPLPLIPSVESPPPPPDPDWANWPEPTLTPRRDVLSQREVKLLEDAIKWARLARDEERVKQLTMQLNRHHPDPGYQQQKEAEERWQRQAKLEQEQKARDARERAEEVRRRREEQETRNRIRNEKEFRREQKKREEKSIKITIIIFVVTGAVILLIGIVICVKVCGETEPKEAPPRPRVPAPAHRGHGENNQPPTQIPVPSAPVLDASHHLHSHGHANDPNVTRTRSPSPRPDFGPEKESQLGVDVDDWNDPPPTYEEAVQCIEPKQLTRVGEPTFPTSRSSMDIEPPPRAPSFNPEFTAHEMIPSSM